MCSCSYEWGYSIFFACIERLDQVCCFLPRVTAKVCLQSFANSQVVMTLHLQSPKYDMQWCE